MVVTMNIYSKKIIISMILSFIFLALSKTSAAKDLTIATFNVPEFIDKTQSGLDGYFYNLIEKTIKKSGVKINIKFLPPKRVIDGFLKGEFDAFFPAIENLIPKEEYIYLDFDYPKKDYIFGLSSKGSVPNTISGLKGKKVGLTIGYPYSDELIKAKGIHFVSVHSDDAGIEMLQKARIDYFVATPNSIYKYIASNKDLFYDIKTPIIEQKSLLYCKKNPQGTRICDALKKHMPDVKKTMKWSEDSIIKEILAKYHKKPK